VIRNRYYDFLKIVSPKKESILTLNTAILCPKLYTTLVCKKIAEFFRRKLVEIAENCDRTTLTPATPRHFTYFTDLLIGGWIALNMPNGLQIFRRHNVLKMESVLRIDFFLVKVVIPGAKTTSFEFTSKTSAL
jgi:hypothetical protein